MPRLQTAAPVLGEAVCPPVQLVWSCEAKKAPRLRTKHGSQQLSARFPELPHWTQREGGKIAVQPDARALTVATQPGTAYLAVSSQDPEVAQNGEPLDDIAHFVAGDVTQELLFCLLATPAERSPLTVSVRHPEADRTDKDYFDAEEEALVAAKETLTARGIVDPQIAKMKLAALQKQLAAAEWRVSIERNTFARKAERDVRAWAVEHDASLQEVRAIAAELEKTECSTARVREEMGAEAKSGRDCSAALERELASLPATIAEVGVAQQEEVARCVTMYIFKTSDVRSACLGQLREEAASLTTRRDEAVLRTLVADKAATAIAAAQQPPPVMLAEVQQSIRACRTRIMYSTGHRRFTRKVVGSRVAIGDFHSNATDAKRD